MKKLLSNLNRTSFKKGSYAVLISVILIAVLVLINYITANLLKVEVDLTKGGAFSLSADSVNYLKEIKEPVKAYVLFTPVNTESTEGESIKSIVNQMAAKNKNIQVEIIDPQKNPIVANKFQQYGYKGGNAVVVEKGTKGKVVDFTTTDPNTGSPSFDISQAEQKLLFALISIQDYRSPKMYIVQGHGEDTQLFDTLSKDLEANDFKMDKLDLMTQEIPADADLLVVLAPKMDFPSADIVKIDNYFKSGKPVSFFMGQTDKPTPNLTNYLAEWGVAYNNDLVFESEPTKIYKSGENVIPTILSHASTKILAENQVKVLFSRSGSITLNQNTGKQITLEETLKTSDNAYSRKDFKNTNPSKLGTDAKGPFTLAAMATRAFDTKKAKMMVAGTDQFLAGNILSIDPYNFYFLVFSMNWLTDKQVDINIMPKNLKADQLLLDNTKSTLLIALVALLPISVIIFSIVVWLRRRHL